VAQTTFEEISASDYVSLYNQGYSINELKNYGLSKLQKQGGCSEDFRFLV